MESTSLSVRRAALTALLEVAAAIKNASSTVISTSNMSATDSLRSLGGLVRLDPSSSSALMGTLAEWTMNGLYSDPDEHSSILKKEIIRTVVQYFDSV